MPSWSGRWKAISVYYMAFALMHANEGAEPLLVSRLAAFVYGAPPSIRHKRNSACDSNAVTRQRRSGTLDSFFLLHLTIAVAGTSCADELPYYDCAPTFPSRRPRSTMRFFASRRAMGCGVDAFQAVRRST
jgi:hypothetical protein